MSDPTTRMPKCPYCGGGHVTCDQTVRGKSIRVVYQCNECNKTWGATVPRDGRRY